MFDNLAPLQVPGKKFGKGVFVMPKMAKQYNLPSSANPLFAVFMEFGRISPEIFADKKIFFPANNLKPEMAKYCFEELKIMHWVWMLKNFSPVFCGGLSLPTCYEEAA